MHRIVLAVLLPALALAACGGEPTRSSAGAPQETLLAKVGDSLVALDTASGRTLQRLERGAHGTDLDAVFTATIDAAAGTTTVVATDPVSGRRLRSIDVPGRWVIPVAAGATPDGALSGDGRVLALAGPSGEGRSHFALLPASLDAQPERFALRGRYDFDAMSPDGSALFLSEIRGDGRYRVRAYDVEESRLRPQVVVEKTAVGQIMQGHPVARAVDPTGSPVHTLYRGGPAGAFVHSLNTADGTALCILLPKSKDAGSKWRVALDEAALELHALDEERGTHYVIEASAGGVTTAPPGTPAPGSTVASPEGARSYAIAHDGAIAVRESGGATRTLPSPGAEAQLLAVVGR